MPLLLDPDQAPSLDALLNAAETGGIQWSLEIPPGASVPVIAGIGSLSSAGRHEISFLSNPRYAAQLAGTAAAAVIVPPEAAQSARESGEEGGYVRVVCAHPYLLYARLAQWFDAARRPARRSFVHPSAIVADDAVLEDDVQVGPHCVIEAGVRIGRGSVLGPGCVLGARSSLGQDCLLHARVTLYTDVSVGHRAILHTGAVLGADGFGFAPDPSLGKGAWGKIPQLGGVVVGDDVEVGANTTIDRGALENTVIGNGVKLDNQIMIAHNVRVGEHTAMAACVGVAGSTVIGARCTIGGASMLSGHITLGDDVHVSGGTAVTSNISKPGRYTGVYPYAEHGEWQRNAAVLQQLAQIRRRVRALEK